MDSRKFAHITPEFMAFMDDQARVQAKLKSFTWQENMKISLVPVIISHIIWCYVDQVLEYSAQNKLPFREAGRKIKAFKELYDYTLLQNMPIDKITEMKKQAEWFYKNRCARDFSVMWYSINNKLYAKKNLKHVDMLTDVYVAVGLIDYLRKYNRRMDQIIKEKLGYCEGEDDEGMEMLKRELIQNYASGKKMDVDRNVELCMNILENNINRVEFDLIDGVSTVG